MQFPIQIGLHRSFILRAALALVTFLAGAGLWMLPVDPGYRVSLLAALIVLAAQAGLRLQAIPGSLMLLDDGSVQVCCVGGAVFYKASVLPGATVHPWLTVFRVKTAEARVFVVIATVDSLSSEQFRRLRVFLRNRALISAEAGAV